jgi:hypothetical protein
MEVILSIFFGGLITIVTAIGVEYWRRPRLSLSIEDPPLDLPAPGGRGRRRNLRLNLRNAPLPRIAKWMQRAPATQCRGEISFHHLDGQNIFGKAMAVRWVKSPEPIASRIVDANSQIHYFIQDFSRPYVDSRIDVYPGEAELLDVAIRFDGESDCYGWNNESYLYDWRSPQWKLPRGRYLVKVVVTSSGQKCADVFRLTSDVDHLDSFRLITASKEDRAKIR